jgi:hypothetical protein
MGLTDKWAVTPEKEALIVQVFEALDPQYYLY